MARRLIVDTGVLIDTERGSRNLGDVVSADDDLVIAAVTVAELRTGVELAGVHQKQARTDFLLRVLETLPVEPYDLASAEAHGRLLAHIHRNGTRRGAHDLIIAATAVATRRTILTTDRNARFQDLPGVDCILVD
jgi:tRNA(fMet)-specific endonuclease VapC